MVDLHNIERSRYVNRLFSRISPKYDFMNTLMSGGRHHAWRRLALDLALSSNEGFGVDVATGTGDFALEAARRSKSQRVVGLDFTPEMIQIAQRKSKRSGTSDRIDWVLSDAHHLPFLESSSEYVTVGFGVRNFGEPAKAFKEMRRVVKPGGRVVILEIVRLSLEDTGLVKNIVSACFRTITPWLGALFAGDKEAYAYLPASVDDFLTSRQIVELMESVGLCNITTRKLAFGLVSICVGEKP